LRGYRGSRREHHGCGRQNDPRRAKLKFRSKFTAPFKQAFFRTSKNCGLGADNFRLPPINDIDRMVAMISTLIARGLAYRRGQIGLFPHQQISDYGKLAHFDLTQLQSTGRVKRRDDKNTSATSRWQRDEEDGDVGWESPGRAARLASSAARWQPRCSAIRSTFTCGVDNIFPHHEAEIAARAALEKFVRYWLHWRICWSMDRKYRNRSAIFTRSPTFSLHRPRDPLRAHAFTIAHHSISPGRNGGSATVVKRMMIG
jgi:cysteinyl-tRNA synthetase